MLSGMSAAGNCRRDERLDFTQVDLNTDFQCGSFCAAEIEFEEFARRDAVKKFDSQILMNIYIQEFLQNFTTCGFFFLFFFVL